MIAIQSKKELFFGQAKIGFIKMEFETITNRPTSKTYEVGIKDTCFRKETETIEIPNESGGTSQKKIENYIELGSVYRYKTFTYEEFEQMTQLIKLSKKTNLSEVEKINEMFRIGLLLTTQKECQEGASGMAGKGMYLSEAGDWEIVKD